MTITQHQQLEIHNLITLRKKAPAAEFNSHAERLMEYITAQGAKKTGGGISATYAVEGNMLDMELYIPIDKEIPSTAEFMYKPKLYLTNCIKATYKGNPQLLESTLHKMNEYIAENNLTPISAGFVVTVNEITDPKDLELFEVDVYISISPNIM